MLEFLTTSGAVITAEARTPEVDTAITVLGGLVISFDSDTPVVVTIITSAVIGTTLTDADGVTYELFPEGWYIEGQAVDVPPYEKIVSATMPGGWSWSA